MRSMDEINRRAWRNSAAAREAAWREERAKLIAEDELAEEPVRHVLGHDRRSKAQNRVLQDLVAELITEGYFHGPALYWAKWFVRYPKAENRDKLYKLVKDQPEVLGSRHDEFVRMFSRR
jgi:hypothetical protein